MHLVLTPLSLLLSFLSFSLYLSHHPSPFLPHSFMHSFCICMTEGNPLSSTKIIYDFVKQKAMGDVANLRLTGNVTHCTVLCYTVLHYSVQYLMYCTVLYCTYCNALYCTALHCTALYSTALYSTALFSTALMLLKPLLRDNKIADGGNHAVLY